MYEKEYKGCIFKCHRIQYFNWKKSAATFSEYPLLSRPAFKCCWFCRISLSCENRDNASAMLCVFQLFDFNASQVTTAPQVKRVFRFCCSAGLFYACCGKHNCKPKAKRTISRQAHIFYFSVLLHFQIFSPFFGDLKMVIYERKRTASNTCLFVPYLLRFMTGKPS